MYEIFSSKSEPNSGERLLNAFLRPVKDAAQAEIIGRSGLVSKYDFGGEIRAQCIHKGVHYIVAGGGFWRIGWEKEYLGALPDGVSSMASGATQIGIVADSAYYVWDSSAGELSKYPPGVLVSVTDIAHIDGYFVLVGFSGGRGDCIQISAVNDATSLNGLDFAFAEGSDDDIVACIVDHGEFWALGSRTVEKYYNDGGDFPLQRNVGTAFERGCLSSSCVAKADNRVFWIGDDRVVYVGSGGELSVISPRWIDEILRESEILGAFAFRDRGTPFFAIRMANRAAVVFDITTGLWHERSSGIDGREWIACDAIGHNGNEWVGTTSGSLCLQDDEVYQDEGETFAMVAQSAPLVFPDERVISLVRVLFGGGKQTFSRTAKVSLQISKDGETWGREKWKNMPKIGKYSDPVSWHGLGQSRHWQARLRITDEVNRDIRGVFYV